MSNQVAPDDKLKHASLEQLESLVRAQGFENFGFAKLEKPFSLALYEAWLEKGYQGEMDYLHRHLPQKSDPQKLLAKALSAIVITINYVPHPEPIKTWPLTGLKVARYAQGRDYHYFIREKLQPLIDELKERHPGHEFVAFTDSSPVLERDLAVRAGLGWIGKNTCLLSREDGSLYFISEIYTTLAIEAASVTAPKDFCGTCTRCIDACPTNALVSPRELDARKCISYLTIESREVPALDLRNKMGDWFYGCDICQTVCPWNQKVFGTELDQPDGDIVDDLKFVLTSSNRALEKAFLGTPLMRAGGIGLKRNAIVVAGNQKSRELEKEIATYVDHPKLGELANWALAQINLL